MIATVVTAALTTLLLHGAYWLWKHRKQLRFEKRIELPPEPPLVNTEAMASEAPKLEAQLYIVTRPFRHGEVDYPAGKEVALPPEIEPAVKMGWLRKKGDPESSYQVPRARTAGIHRGDLNPLRYTVQGHEEVIVPLLVYRMGFTPLYQNLYTVLVKNAPPALEDLGTHRAILTKDNDLVKVLALQNRKSGTDTFREEDAPNLLAWLANPPTDKEEQKAQIAALGSLWEQAPNTEEIVAQILSFNLNQIAEKLVLDVMSWKRQVSTDIEQVFKFHGQPSTIDIDNAIDRELARRSTIPPPEDNAPLSFESMIDVVKFVNRHVPSSNPENLVANSDPPPKPEPTEQGGEQLLPDKPPPEGSNPH